jgi:excinuclease ABC subunit A
MASPNKTIEILGANEHNLKNIDVSIPRDQFVVITGVSGSGKSSLAFDTIFAEGQRKYMESLSSYARQFLNQLDKPDVESVEGLPPTIAIAQRSSSHNPRSTVATTTEIYDYLRLLMARCGTPRCWHANKDGSQCALPITSTTSTQIINSIMEEPKGKKCMICSPVVVGKKGYHRDILENLRSEGFVRARVNGTIVDLRDVLLNESDNPLELGRYELHTIEAIVDRIVLDNSQRERIADSVEVAVQLSGGSVLLLVEDGESWSESRFSEQFACSEHPACSLQELEPRMFSFNSHFGACKNCDGLGTVHEFDPNLIIPDESQTLQRKAVAPWNHSMPSMRRRYKRALKRFCDSAGIDQTKPFDSLSKTQQNVILHGGSVKGSRAKYVGVISELQKRFKQTESDNVRQWLMTYMTKMCCESCHGHRLRPEAQSVTVTSCGKEYSIVDLTQLTITDMLQIMKSLDFSSELATVAEPIRKEIVSRLTFLVSVGLDYLSLDRTSSTLSGGEAQRIRLATQVGSGLVGVCYVLDEPTIGLHARDNARLLKTLRHLTEIGNTVIVVEHDEMVIEHADHIIDVGPAAGIHGGSIVAQGTSASIKKNKHSITGDYLARRKTIQIPPSRRNLDSVQLATIQGASHNNLKNINIAFPLQSLVCVTGVSGSGKSSLVNHTLLETAISTLHKKKPANIRCKKITGLQIIDRVIEVDQSPIGRTPRSNPATYTNIFDGIRSLFTQTREAKIRGYKPGRFSFNVKGGRCEACQGQGVKKIEMHFLPDTYVTCEECEGARYNAETLQVKWRGYTISDILNTTIENAISIFESHGRIERMLRCLIDVGLGYLTLGQPSTTLSGGEAQRVKLASELGVRSNNHTLYVLDEPTTGLHFADVDKLLQVLQRLVDAGNSVVVIEHNLEVIKCADWIIDLGPEGGDGGGQVIAEGTPEQVATSKNSFTGKELLAILPIKKTTSGRLRAGSSKN